MSEAFNPTAVYAAFMQEVKGRLGDIGHRLDWIAANPEAESAVFEAEQTFLHTRFICELVALSALSAHHSYGLGRDLLKAYRADNIFTRLVGVNPFCFPVPVVGTKGADGITHFVVHEEGRMDSERLKTIYNQVDNALHRGRLKHAVAGEQKVYDLSLVARWRTEFVSLLSQHLILFPQEERVLLVTLNGDAEGRVKVIQAEADGPFAVGPGFGVA